MHQGILGLSWVSWQQITPWRFANSIWLDSQAKQNCVAVSDYERVGLQIYSNAATFTGIWSKFRCAGESSAYVLSRITIAPAQHICQSHVALRHSRWYWVLQLEYETQLTYLWQSRSFSSHLIKVQVHRKCLSTYAYNQWITAYLPIPVAT